MGMLLKMNLFFDVHPVGVDVELIGQSFVQTGFIVENKRLWKLTWWLTFSSKATKLRLYVKVS